MIEAVVLLLLGIAALVAPFMAGLTVTFLIGCAPLQSPMCSRNADGRIGA